MAYIAAGMGHATMTDTRALSRDELVELGRSLRGVVPRSSHADTPLERPGRDPLAVIDTTNASRVADLVPVRWSRMAASAFGFFRGAPAVMAADLAGTGVAGVSPQLCGDAHVANFGLFATPERRLAFDLNDFDETLAGPFDWDVKRLAASVVVASRAAGHPAQVARAAAVASAIGYAQRARELSELSPMEIWYLHTDVDAAGAEASADVRPVISRAARKARGRTHLQAFEKLASLVDGRPQIVEDPPLVMRLRMDEQLDQLQAFFDEYLATLPAERRHLLRNYRLVDAARKVVGVGSVGTRCYIALGLGHAQGDPVFLQIKEAQASVLEPHLGSSPHAHAGERVVVGQRLVQANGDAFLGWSRGPGGSEYFVRQLRDMKGGFEIESLTPAQMSTYAVACGRTLARAHARTLHPALVSGYLGSGRRFAAAIAEFAEQYATQNDADHAALVQAVADGTVAVAAYGS